jgi:filamentous hemagglutinin family protein
MMRDLSIFRNCGLTLVLLAGALLLQPSFSSAQITLDGTLGQSGSLSGPDYVITDGMGQVRGTNLFHSFDEFNVRTGESATFTGPDTVQNVIGRVTGGSASVIDGLLRCTIPDANLFLLNPWGFLFGANAALDVNGSFHVSTGEYLRCADGGVFSANPAVPSVLTSSPPEAFGFLGTSPGSIALEGSSLAVPEGKDLSLVGGDISLSGVTVHAPGGRLTLASGASAGEFSLHSSGVIGDTFSAYGDITLSQGARALASGQGAGSIKIRGGNLVIDDATVGILYTGDGPGGDVEIEATEGLELSGGLIGTVAAGEGEGGDVHVTTGTLRMDDGAQIGTSTSGNGAAGDVSVSATESITVTGRSAGGQRTAIYSQTDGAGNSGEMRLAAPELTVSDQAGVFNLTYGTGTRGDLTMEVNDLLLTGDARVAGGDIFVNSDRIAISDGAFIWSMASEGAERGVVEINARESLSIYGRGEPNAPWRERTNPLYTGIHSDVFLNADGDAANIFVTAPTIEIANSGEISARTYTSGSAGEITIETERLSLLSGGEIAVDSFGSSGFYGPAGRINVRASDSIFISGENYEHDSGVHSATRSSGNAGQIQVDTPLLTIADGGGISVSTGIFGSGDTGSITLDVGRLEILSGGWVSASSSGLGDKGLLEINASDSIFIHGGYIFTFGYWSGVGCDAVIRTPSLTMTGGAITSQTDGDRDGGDISIYADEVALSEGARIMSDSFSYANAGNILVEAGEITLTGGAQVTSTSEVAGLGGDITLRTENMDLSDGARISAQSNGTGNAGTITLEVENQFRCQDSAVTTAAQQADGGNIRITAGHLVHLVDGEISAAVGGGPQTVGGNITMGGEYVVLDGSSVIANAYEGRGGNIGIEAGTFIADPESVVSASSELGIDGTVDIRAPVINISGIVAPLPKSFLSAAELLREPCAARIKGGKASSFVVTGRDALPTQPGGPLVSPMN